MFHGRLDQATAAGLKVLRNRIDAAKIPPSRLDETLILATWNVREFGRKSRSAASIHYIAEILGQFDLIAITELRDNLGDLRKVMDILGPYWRVVFSDFNSDAAGNRERIAYLYDSRAAVFTGLAAEADPPKRKNRSTGKWESTIEWWRSPFIASFRAGNFDFVLLTAHIRWGKNEDDREPALKALAQWVNKRMKEKHVFDRDIILLGDFNIPSTTNKLFDAITRKGKGLSIPRALLNVSKKEAASNLNRNKRYDQILHYSDESFSLTGKAGVLDFYKKAHRPLFPADRYPEMDKTKFTYQLSDHLPLWVELKLQVDDEKLDQILNPNRRRSG